MVTSDIQSILSSLKQSDDNKTTLTEAWSQGRSAFGGIAAAFAVTGMEKLLDSPQPMRSLMVSFIAPLPPGVVAVDAQIQRQGKNVTQISASVLSEGKVCLQAMGVFGNSRKGLKVPAETRRKLVPRDQGIQFRDHAKRLPGFLNFFEGCWVGDGLPFSGKLSRTLNMWVRHQEELSSWPTEKMVCIADIPPPVILSSYQKPPVPSSSLTWSLEFVVPPTEINCDWFYLEMTTDAAAEGYTQQSGKIFDENGHLCALSRQCMVYFEPSDT